MTERQRLDKLTIRGFRGLSNLELDELGDFNVLLGANDVGKTSVLEAIFLLTGFANLQLPIRVNNWRSLVVRDFDDLSLFFNDLNTETPIKIEAVSGSSTELRTLAITVDRSETGIEQRSKSGSNGDASSVRGTTGAADRSTSSIPSGRHALRYQAAVKRGSSEEPFSFSDRLVARDGNLEVPVAPQSGVDEMISAAFIHTRYEYNFEVIGEVIVSKKKDDLIKYMRIINSHIVDIATSGPVVHVDTELRRMMPLNMFGSGMVRAAMMLAHLIRGDQRILLIDELENGLHYRAIPPLLQALMKLASDRGIQVYVTTHSLDLLSALQQVLSQEEFSDHRSKTNCYVLQADKDGQVRSYRYAYSQFDHCLAHGIEIR